MLQHGFDLTESCMRDILHTVIESIDSAESSDRAQALIRFLLENGVDVNWQREKDWYTALHVACCRNLYAIAYLLLIYSADPNAIAQNDDMPLICAERVNPTIPYEQEQNDQLIQILKDHHARRTWRRSSSVSIEKDIHNNKQKEVYKSKAIEPVEKLNTSFQKILRFSDSCNLGITFDTCNDSASTDSHDTGTATLTAA
jgi:ankyrin repeat protein